MNTVYCPSCGKSLPISANFCAACGKTITSPEQQAVHLEYAPTQHAYATVEMSHIGDDLTSSPTVTYYPLTHSSSLFAAVKGSPSQRLSDARMPKTDPPRWSDGDDGDDVDDDTLDPFSDEGLFYEGTWHKELDAPSLHLHDLPAPRPSSPHPIVVRKPHFPRRTSKSSFVLVFWSALALFMLVLAGSFGLATNWGHNLFAGAGTPTLTASATTLAPGDTLTLHGSHFTPHGRIGLTRDASILINDTNGTNIVQANGQGDFTDSIIIVDDWQPGSHVINAEDAVRHKITQIPLLITGTNGSARPAHFNLSVNTLNMGIGDSATNSQQTMTLTNIGGGQLTWKGTSSQSWLMLTPNDGTLASGQKTQVTIAVERNGMIPGSYSGQILFSSDAGNNPLSVSMQVIPLSVQSGAVLALSPAVLSFNGMDGASAPSGQVVTVSNPGSQALQWGVTSNQSWLSASPLSGNVQGGYAASTSSLAGTTGRVSQADLSRLMETAQGATQQAISVNVNTSSMLPGTYNAVLTFTAQEQNGQVRDGVQTIPVSLTIQPQCTIQVAPSLVSFAAVYQQAAPTAKTINVTDSQGCTSPVKWSVASSAAWLSVSNTSGTTPTSPQVSVNIVGLAPGTYNSSLVFTTSAGTQTLPVSLTIGQATAPVVGVSVSTLSYSATAGSSSPPSQIATISNTGGGTLSWQAAAVTSAGGSWLTVSPASGILTSKQSVALSIGASLGTLVPGTYTGTVALSGTDGAGHAAVGSPQMIQVSFVVSAPCSVTMLPTALTFVGVTGQTTVTPQPVTLTASGACADPLSWSAVSSSAWLVPTATTGGFSLSSAGTISVGASLAGLAPGTYPATLTVTTTDSVTKAVIGVPQKIAATLTVQTPCTLSAPSKPTLTFAADAGQSAGAQTFVVSVSGSCTGAVTLTPSITVSAGTGWLAVTPTSASVAVGGSATFTVSASAASLTSGSYTGSISLAGLNGSASIAGSPQVVGVTLTVTSPPVLAASPGSASIHGTYGVISQPVVIANSGGGTLNWSAAAGSGTPSFLSLSATSGSLAAGANTSINMVANTPLVVAGSYTINVTVAATEAVSGATVSGSPTTVAITVTVAPPTMQVSSTSLSYTATAGSNPAPQNVTITNGGGGTLTWSIGSVSASWLSVSNTSGSDTAGQSSPVTFSVNAASLAAGTYNATAVITPSVGQPVTINVNLVLSGAPTPTPSPTTGVTPGITATVGYTPTPTPTATVGVTPTATAGVTPTATAGVTPTATKSATSTLTSTTMATDATFAIPPAKPASV